MEINCHEAFIRRSRPVVKLEKKCDFSKKVVSQSRRRSKTLFSLYTVNLYITITYVVECYKSSFFLNRAGKENRFNKKMYNFHLHIRTIHTHIIYIILYTYT